MNNFSTTTAIILDTRRIKNDNTYPVKLRITHNREQKYYFTGINLTKSDFEKTESTKPRGNFKETKIFLNSVEQKARNIINVLDEFSFEKFKKHFLNTKSNQQDVFKAYELRIDELKQEGRVATASGYLYSLNSLKLFASKLSFNNITPDFLKAYERWMLQNDKSITSIGIYLRCLRAIYNDAISEGIVKQEQYPFGKRKYQIPASRNIKKALKLSEIEKIFNYKAEKGSTEEKARDLWIFSYLCNGVNIKDIARLKYKNMDKDKIVFIRAKTENTTRQNLKPIVAIITPELKTIVKKWGTMPKVPENYIFPILAHDITPEQELAKVKQATKIINKYIRKIAKKLGLDEDITTYTARHSYATILKKSGASREFISESLGHSNLQTTENYLDSFEIETKKEFAKVLTKFKKE